MATGRVTICNKKGLHARAAAKLVKAAASYDAQIRVVRLQDGIEASSAGATSILGLLMLAAERGVDIELQANGVQAKEAVDAIVGLVSRRFDELE